MGIDRAVSRLRRAPIVPDSVNTGRAESNHRAMHDNFVFDTGLRIPPRLSGKLSMGIGGVNACVISRPSMS